MGTLIADADADARRRMDFASLELLRRRACMDLWPSLVEQLGEQILTHLHDFNERAKGSHHLKAINVSNQLPQHIRMEEQNGSALLLIRFHPDALAINAQSVIALEKTTVTYTIRLSDMAICRGSRVVERDDFARDVLEQFTAEVWRGLSLPR